MPNRDSRLTVSIPTASPDGRFYGRYPQGDKPVQGAALAGAAQSSATLSAAISAQIRLLANAAGAAAGSSALSTAIRMRANAIANAQATASISSGFNFDADFQLIAQAATLGATDFNRVWEQGVIKPARAITSKASLIAQAIGIGNSSFSGRPAGQQAADHIEWDTTRNLFGTGCLRFNTMDTDGAAGGSWQINTNFRDGTVYKKFYCLVIGEYDKETLGYRWKISGTNGASNSNLKIFNLGTAGGGQVVPCNSRFLGFITAFINQSSGNIASNSGDNINTPNPFGTTCWHIHNQVDTGEPLSDKSSYLRRYGPLPRGMDGEHDLSYNPAQYLYERAHVSGWPDTRAALNAWAIPLDKPFVIEVLYDYNEADPSDSTIYFWGADYGDPPRLFYKATNVPLFTNSDQVAEINLLNYDTERVDEPGVRPTLYTFFHGIATSETPMPFPGGFPLPQAPDSPDPAWFIALNDLEVTRRGNNTIDSLRPAGVGQATFDDVVQAWCGGGFNQLRYIFTIPCPAGHVNYDGGQNLSYDVILENWFTHTTVNADKSALGDPEDGTTVLGTPQPTHTYDACVVVADELWLTSMGSVDQTPSGEGSSMGWVWNYATNQPIPFDTGTKGWTQLGINTLSGSSDYGATAYDPITDFVWFCKRFTSGGSKWVASWNRQTKVRTEYTVTGGNTFGDSGDDLLAVVVYDGAGNSALMIKGNSRVRTVNLQTAVAGGALAFETPTWTGTAQPSGKCRVHYIPETGQLITWEIGTNNLLVADRPANIRTGTYAWRRVTLTGVAITPQAANGTYGRFQVFRMPSGRYAVFLVNDTDEQVHIGKLPIGAIP